MRAPSPVKVSNARASSRAAKPGEREHGAAFFARGGLGARPAFAADQWADGDIVEDGEAREGLHPLEAAGDAGAGAGEGRQVVAPPALEADLPGIGGERA